MITQADRLPPQDIRAEMAVNGALMYRAPLPDALRPAHFYCEQNRKIYVAITDLLSEEKPVNADDVGRALLARGWLDDAGGPMRIMECLESVNHGLNIEHDAAIVIDKATRREIIYKARETEKAAFDPTCDIETVLASADFSRIGGYLDRRFKAMTSKELARGDFSIKYLIEDFMVAGQPLVFGGGKKELKTTLLCDIAISLALEMRVFGKFWVPNRTRVGIMSGESGQGTIQETARRIARAKGFELEDDRLDCLVWEFTLPQLGDPIDMMELRRFVVDNALEVLILDPAFLMMDVGESASNIFAMGPLLRGLSELAQATNCTPALAHHTRRTNKDQFAPPELDHLAWAGFQEWARQWLIVGRREKYNPERGGSHRLWLTVGGSAGHSGMWGLNVEEGTRSDPGGRHWNIEVVAPSQAREETTTVGEAEKVNREEAKKQATTTKNRQKVLDAFRVFPDGESKKTIRESAGMSGETFGPIFAKLYSSGMVETCRFGKGSRQYDGYRLTEKATWDNVGQRGTVLRSPDESGTEGDKPPYRGAVPVPLTVPVDSEDLSGILSRYEEEGFDRNGSF